jgi:hypothetical protein
MKDWDVAAIKIYGGLFVDAKGRLIDLYGRSKPMVCNGLFEMRYVGITFFE